MAANYRNTLPIAGGAQFDPLPLPLDGFTRWNDLKLLIPMSHEAIRQRELAGRFPKRVKLGSARCVAWPNREIHRWLADPAGYRACESA
ncbi:AlpA family phage regulatory protein [Burkholderia cenocepacia]|uniref:helix-turn-helix transcriptional regulator n=1 Tax=Burkholderia cenocepacia TaxID=95486 RepID=UPI001B8DEB6E|nr:AlpA family phage regulatory protein [Burkholderia cenocepacia]MBR8070052.1 AlpA family phage regulatory protein [Burkholderia cenocepacia]MBR8443808.1 AlpA family phage regulatory protein [Burkholderia cenocepacia]